MLLTTHIVIRYFEYVVGVKNHRLCLIGVIKFCLKVYKLNTIVNATFFLLAILICFLRHPTFISKSNKLNYKWIHLYETLDTWSNRQSGPYLQMFDIFLWYDVPEWMLLKQTQIYEHMYLCFSHQIFVPHFFQNKVYVDFLFRHLWINVELNNENIMISV